MNIICKFILLIFLSFILISCDDGNSGNFKINLKLPVSPSDISITCAHAEVKDDDTDFDKEEKIKKSNFCILNGDQIMLSIYSTADISEDYSFVDRKIIKVTNNVSGETDFVRNLKPSRYYKFYVEVTNKNEKTKLSGGAEGIFFEDSKNYDINLFLGVTGDFVRVVHNQTNESGLKTYIPEAGSSGTRAVALRDGRIFYAGGSIYNDIDTDTKIEKTAQLVDLTKMSVTKVKDLPFALTDFSAGLINYVGSDKKVSETGRVVIAFGKKGDSYSDKIYLYDPLKDSYQDTGAAFSGRAFPQSLVIGGEVYIVGGCSDSLSLSDIIKVDKSGKASKIGDLKQGRCLHSVSELPAIEGKTRMLVLGGTKKADGTDFITGELFAEIITVDGDNATSDKVAIEGISDQATLDSIKANPTAIAFSLASHASTTLNWDTNKGPSFVVLAVGGFLNSEGTRVVSPSTYLFRTNDDGSKWIYQASGSSFKCAYPSLSKINAKEYSNSQYAVLNCGTDKVARNPENTLSQYIYIMEAQAAPGSTAGLSYNMNISAKNSLFAENNDTENNSVYLDGPVTTNDMGQAFVFGTTYIYMISGFSL